MSTYSQAPEIVEKAIAWNTASIGTGVVCATLNPGDVLESHALEITEAWDSATSDTATVGIADDDLNPKAALATYDLKGGVVAGADVAPVQVPATGSDRGGRAVTSGAVYISIASVGGGLAHGAAKVRCVIRRADTAQTYQATPTMTVNTNQVHSWKS